MAISSKTQISQVFTAETLAVSVASRTAADKV